MATQNDVRDLALSLPATTEDPDEFAFSVDGWRCRAPKRVRAELPSSRSLES